MGLIIMDLDGWKNKLKEKNHLDILDLDNARSQLSKRDFLFLLRWVWDHQRGWKYFDIGAEKPTKVAYVAAYWARHIAMSKGQFFPGLPEYVRLVGLVEWCVFRLGEKPGVDD